ncbi:chromatin structure-remodeling complex subunit RSC7 [Friedmanniomyces endolithicus]|uniref:Chromatin structure-remodeling complex subunit RSC7 n=1 Tax=Rachicladosporium monterosium TaxID=1507873 RepID=A0ABR0LCJ2_9PEZI|nr:chromatin structure-remodeling complex subunit RSC7 [Friedmanniomyces endolithicus]KAK5146403.1 chromatin structure-remodeling complex subunit RSC7 [Rachicladosporium monterosium]
MSAGVLGRSCGLRHQFGGLILKLASRVPPLCSKGTRDTASKDAVPERCDNSARQNKEQPPNCESGNTYGGKRNRGTIFTRTPNKVHDWPEDDDMLDDDGEEGVVYDEDVDEEAEEDAGTPAQDEDGAEDDGDAPPTVTAMPARRRGRGRGRGSGIGRRSARDYGTPQPHDGDGEEGSESGTPFRRRRGGRPEGSARGRGRGGFRGRRRGALQAEAPRQVIDKNGRALDVVDEEVQVDDDEEGNTKVDAKGNLQGGRDYRVRTFKILGKEDRLYMLSTEPARCCGFRDSYLFFAKHPKLWKVLLAEEEKKDLIDRDILPSSYKGRNIGVVTARSVYREFGAKIIVGGRRVIDDYKVALARANGEVEGELADPEDRIPVNKGDYDRNRYVAWFGASEVYRIAAQGAVPGKPGLMGKRRTNVTVGNWQYMHAREASRFNTFATAARRSNLDGVYDAHTNMMFYPQIMQPTHARWEQIPPPSTASTLQQQGITTNGHHLTNGTTPHENSADNAADDLSAQDQPQEPTLFPPIPPIISRNFAIIDTHFLSPSLTNPSHLHSNSTTLDMASSGHSGMTGGNLAGISLDVLAELPEECRAAFEVAKRAEMGWKGSWGREGEVGMRPRRGLGVGLSGFPV